MERPFSYIQKYYGVPAEFGRRVEIDSYGPGIIVEDRGNYIGVNLDKDKPSVVKSFHPTCGVEYGEMGKPRPLTRGQKRYLRYLSYGDGFQSFIDFCRWDAEPERPWN